MSRNAWATLAASAAFTCGVIYYVHYSQTRDRMRLREGILFDMDRQQRKVQNVYQLEKQADLTKIMRQHEKDRSVLDRAEDR